MKPLGFFFLLLVLASCHEDAGNEQLILPNDLVLMEEQLYYYPSTLVEKVDSLKTVVASDEDHPYLGQIAFLCGFMAYHKGEVDSALVYIEESLLAMTQLEDSAGQAKCYLLLGWIAEGIGSFDQAKINYYKVINFSNASQRKENGLAWLGISRCKKILKEPIKNEFKQGISYLKATGIEEFILYAEFSKFMFGEKNEEAAINIKEVAKEYKNLKLENNAASVYKVLAKYYMGQGLIDSSKTFVDEAIDIYDGQYSQVSLMPGLKQFKGVLFFQERDYKRARQLLLESLKLYDKFGKEGHKYYAYKYLYRIDTLQGNYQRAVKYQSKAFYCFKVAQNKEKQLMSKVIEVDINVLLMRKTIDSLKYRSIRNKIIFGSSILIILLILLTLFQLIRVRYRNVQRREQERTRQLQNLLIGLGEKRLLQQRYCKSFEEIPIDTDQPSSLTDDFSLCYIETIREFSRCFSELSDTEIRYAVMFALNLSSDVITEIQNVQIATIRKVKQRIRQKMNMSKDKSVESYFQQFLQTEAYNKVMN